jgi:hypothetical protein
VLFISIISSATHAVAEPSPHPIPHQFHHFFIHWGRFSGDEEWRTYAFISPTEVLNLITQISQSCRFISGRHIYWWHIKAAAESHYNSQQLTLTISSHTHNKFRPIKQGPASPPLYRIHKPLICRFDPTSSFFIYLISFRFLWSAALWSSSSVQSAASAAGRLLQLTQHARKDSRQANKLLTPFPSLTHFFALLPLIPHPSGHNTYCRPAGWLNKSHNTINLRIALHYFGWFGWPAPWPVFSLVFSIYY